MISRDAFTPLVTETIASPAACPVTKPVGEIESTADLELRQMAEAVTSALVPSERCAIAVSCAVPPGATEPGPMMSIRLMLIGGGPGGGRKLDRVGVLSQDAISATDATEKQMTRVVVRMVVLRTVPFYPRLPRGECRAG
jgi:hypothetical protein